MVGVSTILAVCVTFLISMVLPIVVYIIYGVKNKGKGVWTAWLLGAAGFVIFQVIIRIPILNGLAGLEGFQTFATQNYALYCLILAFTAGLFEVAGRYIVAKIMQKNLTFERGFAAGLGHGGIESIVLIGTMYLNNLIYILMINTGSFDTVIQQTAAAGVDTAALVSVQDALVNSGCGVYLLAGYERILTMIFHTALSLMVCYFVTRKKDALGIILCLICHTIIDFVSPLINGMANGYLGNGLSTTTAYIIIYSFLTVVAVVAVIGIVVLKKRFSVEDKNCESSNRKM